MPELLWLCKVAACMLRVCEVDVRDDVDDAAVCLLGKAFILATVARLHVENRDMQSLRRDGGEAGVGVAENEKRVGLCLCHKLVGAVDDIADGGAKVIANGIHIHLGVRKLQILEEHAVEVVVIVLTRVSENAVKVLTALIDNGGKADDLGAGAHDNQELQPAVIFEFNIAVIQFNIHM